MKHSIDTNETTRALARAKSNSLGATARRHRVDDTALPMSAPSGEAGGSRLDRLIRLLDTGSSLEARREAARQIGELAASHANQLPNLLRRVRAHLRSKKWETRTAASATLSEISSRLKHPTVETLIKLESEEAAVKREDGGGNAANANAPYGTGSDALDLTFAKFNVEAVLEKAGILLSSSGTSWHLEHGPGTKAERLAQAKASLKRRLGMELGPEAGAMMDENMKMSDLVKDEDLLDDDKDKVEVKEKVAVGDSAAEAVDGLTGDVDYSHLSARELNKLKRKAKRMLREGIDPAHAKRSKKDEEAARIEKEKAEAEEDDEEQAEVEAGGWPLARTCEALAYMMFSEGWEERHGAAAALREVLRHQAASAAIWAPPPGIKPEPGTIEAARDANAAWLEDMCVRLLCILALDRFGDFAGDGAVAPVRETSAQALGAALLPLAPDAVDAVVSCTLTLLSRPEWEVRHSALLGLKYILAAKSELALDLLPAALPAATKALVDADDDVRGAAAESLLPAAEHLPKHPKFNELLSSLWGLLNELDDLSPSAVPVMKLIAKLYALQSTREKSNADLAEVVPRLWPFAAHPMASVRLAVWQTLLCLLAVEPDASTQLWVQEACAPAMRHAFQGALLDVDRASAEAATEAWSALLRAVPVAIIEATFMVHGGKWTELSTTVAKACGEGKLIFVSTPPSVKGEIRAVAKDWPATTAGRLRGLECLAKLAAAFGAHGRSGAVETMEKYVTGMLTSAQGTARLAGAHLLNLWLHVVPPGPQRPALQSPGAQLGTILANTNPAYPSAPSPSPYGEVAQMVKYVKSESMAFLRVAATNGVKLTGDVPSPEADGFGADSAATLSAAIPQSDNQAVETARSSLHASAQRLRDAEAKIHGSVLAAAAGAAVGFGALPPKLNPFIQPLMASVRRERDEVLQGRGAASISSMLKLCAERKPSPNDKLIKNITSMVCGDEEETLKAGTTKDVEVEEDASAKKKKSPAGIVDEDVISDAAIARRGGEAVVRAISSTFGADVFNKLGALTNIMVKPITQAPSESAGVAELQTLVDALQMLKVYGPVAHESLQPKVIELTKAAFAAALYADVAVRKTAASTIATVASKHPERVIGPLLEYIVPQLEQGEAASETAKRSGAVGLASELVKQLGATLAPYCVLLLVPLMGRMSDPDLAIRSAATRAFASLVPLLPLASGKEPPSELTDAQKERSKKDGAFLEALLDNSKIEDFKLPFKCSRTLRPYQQDGVNWLAFLRRFKLHGALADDMGLGKTLQSTCILAATTVERRESGAKTLPHLVICPTTLVGHWAHEIGLYVEPDVLRPLEYQGTPAERDALQKHFDKYDVVIMSYESARADAHTLDKFDWCYCVLDEGHAIRNPKSRVTQAVKQVRAEHRLLLSGTPIQNDVVELWSLFDFLMPGFLGTEREFKSTYGIAAARSAAAKKGGGLTEQGALATGALHKQVMPFVMRRTKDQVLKDLPPKIIQDVYVELTETQRKMYDAFESSEAKNEAVAAVESGGSAEGAAQHVFTTLQYLRKLCSHPKLVANDPKKLKKIDPELRSPKFDALKQILLDCGIGVDVEEEKASGESKPNPASGSGHRVLVFSQLKSLLDLVETELFTSQMRDVSWLRLDGGVAPSQRFEVVRKFNADPSIDVLLLTTHVGGLGLNLTSADTVVFLEHDWNPQKDLQAMDRAHRLGQRRTVNVYRILTRGTLEEKIMSLQRFKLDVANAVVNADNASMSAMDTGQMLELFTAEKGAKLDKDGRPVAASASAATKGAAAAAAGAASGGLANIVNGLEELWDESQYAEEFSVDDFVSKLQK